MMERVEERTTATTRPLLTWLAGRLAELCAVIVGGFTVLAGYMVGAGYADIEPVVWRVGVAGTLCLGALALERWLGGPR